MNKQKTATTSSATNNLIKAKSRHHLRENTLSVGDWVGNGSSRPGEIVEIVELKAGSPKIWVKWSGDNQTNPEDPKGLTLIDPKDLTWTWVESKLIRHHDRLECNDVKFLVTELKLCQFRLSEAKARNDSSAVKKQESRISYLKELQKLAIVIDPQFLTLIPPLSHDEKQQLEANLLEHGCRDALVIWEKILLDGHNRFELCKKHNLDFQLHFINLPDRKAAHDWIIMNQLGRRNLSSDWMSNLRGKMYQNEKLSHGGARGNQHTKKYSSSDNLPKSKNWALAEKAQAHQSHSDQCSSTSHSHTHTQIDLPEDNLAKSNSWILPKSEVNTNTASRLANQFGVTRNTIHNDAKYANAIDKLCYNFGQEWRAIIINSKLKRTQVVELAKYVEDENYYEEIESILSDAERGDDFKADYQALMSKIKGTEFTKGQLVQIKFSSLEGLPEEQRLSNGQYALIAEIYDHSYQVQLLGEKELMVKAEDLKPVKVASYTVSFEPSEFARLSQQFNSPSELEAALKTRLLE